MPAVGDVAGYDDAVLYDAPVSYSLPAGATTLRLYEALGPAMRAGDEQTGYPLLSWIDGPASLLGDVDDLVRDGDELPGWAGLFTSPPPGLRPWVAQALSPTRTRGTLPGLRSAVAATLTGTAEIDVHERTDEIDTTDRPYRFVVRTLREQTPAPAATAAALLAATPAGMRSALRVVQGGRAGYLDGYTDTYA